MGRVRDLVADLTLIDAVRAEIISLPAYGFCRAGALVNRSRILISMLQVNHKRSYRSMTAHYLLPPAAPRRRASSRPHDGKSAVSDSTHAGT